MPDHIDPILRKWPYDPQALSVRLIKGADGREILQMRVDLGVLQLECEGRPDGQRPHGFETYYDYLQSLVTRNGSELELDEDQRSEIDREFVQYYHRRICWLRLQDYRRAVEDAQHTLGLMRFCAENSDDEQWVLSHEQYRPFVLLHRIQAEALAELEDGEGYEASIKAIDQGLQELWAFYAEHEAEDRFEEDDIVVRLREFRDSLQEHFDHRFKLDKELKAAIAAEEYERAAEIRDQLDRLNGPSR